MNQKHLYFGLFPAALFTSFKALLTYLILTFEHVGVMMMLQFMFLIATNNEWLSSCCLSWYHHVYVGLQSSE